MTTYILHISCPDRKGIVHAVTGFLANADIDGNIEDAQQFHESETDSFHMRVQFTSDLAQEPLRVHLSKFVEEWSMEWQLHDASAKLKTVIFCSKEGHCLNDLFFRFKTGLLPIDVRAVVSNHRDFYQLAASYNVPFHHIPVSKETKAEAEKKQLEVIRSEGAELVVLARYMQILSDVLCQELKGQVINIHHSFLPSFIGAKPYHQAHRRGVKLIGATAHYVTAQLDEGPIIEQDVTRVDHSKTVEDFVSLGKDVECQVLAPAVKWHAEHRVLMAGTTKTVVFK